MNSNIARLILASVISTGTVMLALSYHPTLFEMMAHLSPCITRRDPEDAIDPRCLDAAVNNLLQQFSTREVMSNINDPNAPDDVARNCHVIGHLIGHKTFQRSKNLEDSFEQCTIKCRHACMHGAVAESMFEEVGSGVDVAHAPLSQLQRTGKKYCDTQRFLCHAVGHFLRISVANNSRALSVCDLMGKNREMCYAGVFMEDSSATESSILQRDSPSSIPPNYSSPCSSVEWRYKDQCYRYLPVYQGALFDRNGIKTSVDQIRISFSACESLPSQERSMCFFGMGQNAYRLRDDDGKMIDLRQYCSGAQKTSDETACAIGIVRKYISSTPAQYDKAIAYCENAALRDVDGCLFGAFKMTEALPETQRPAKLCRNNSDHVCIAAADKFDISRDTIPQYYLSFSDE